MRQKQSDKFKGEKVMCSLCGMELKSGTPESKHRRCGGQLGAKLKDKIKKLPKEQRGTWEKI